MHISGVLHGLLIANSKSSNLTRELVIRGPRNTFLGIGQAGRHIGSEPLNGYGPTRTHQLFLKQHMYGLWPVNDSDTHVPRTRPLWEHWRSSPNSPRQRSMADNAARGI